MTEAKKESKAKVAKPKLAKAKPAAKPRAKAIPAAKPAPKAPEVKVPVAPKVKKVRGPNKKAKGSLAAYENLLKHEAELEKARKAAKSELKSEYDGFIKQADEIKVKYQKLFNENIGSAPKAKAKGTSAKKNAWKSFSLDQVQSFIDQIAQGGKIKIEGKNAIGVKKIQAAYDKAKNKDAESVLELLK